MCLKTVKETDLPCIQMNNMMEYNLIFIRLEKNLGVFRSMFEDVVKEEYLWRQSPEKWCMLEILCHLHDEEKEDFRARVEFILNDSKELPPSIDPVGWVTQRDYISRNYIDMLDMFLEERKASISMLWSMEKADWNKFFEHPQLGKVTAHMMLCNWLAHDYLHFRQIIRLKYDYLKSISVEDLQYAGIW